MRYPLGHRKACVKGLILRRVCCRLLIGLPGTHPVTIEKGHFDGVIKSLNFGYWKIFQNLRGCIIETN